MKELFLLIICAGRDMITGCYSQMLPDEACERYTAPSIKVGTKIISEGGPTIRCSCRQGRMAGYKLGEVSLSDGDDDVFEDKPSSSSTPRILRSSQASKETEDNEENKQNEANLSSSSATELFKKQRLSFDGVDGAEDLRGFNQLAYHPKAIQILLCFLMRGLHGRTCETVFKTLCASLTELKGQNPPTAATINSKRFCIETLAREQLIEEIQAAKPGGCLLIDDATLVHSARATGIVYVNTKGRAFSIGLYETLVSKGEDMAKQILAKLRALPFWSILKQKIGFLVSDSCAAQLHANQLIIEGLKSEEGISAVEIVCQMHATAWLERYTYKDWSEKKPAKKILFNPDPNDESLNTPDPDVAKASKVFTAIMTLFGARTLNLTGHHAKSLRNELEAQQEVWIVILICSIPFFVFYGALKEFHAVVSETSSSYNIIFGALKRLEDYYNAMMADEKNCFSRMITAVKDEDESMKAVLARIRTQFREPGAKSQEIFKRKKKWEEIGKKVADHDGFLTGTSRLVERVFGVLKNLERSHARLGLRRTFIVAEAMYNKTAEWLEEMTPAKQEAIVKKAMLERPKNEKKAKELEKEDRQIYLLKNARDEEEIAREAEIMEENEEDDAMEVVESVEDEPELEIGESIEDEPEFEDEESVSVPF
ncbi:Oidioi.mRNA.OKI2018_I69.chr2.g5643.t1.cds [Oikopleura dioica]|uniref:Oidioi.mRNA.OKI2018_I69.chr2.g5643.t1.cds n=1 Tax=Oikopleura dioica TaxID=34765 RepID=A0ABN7TA26_OIKDI|nr:Oidioi.mRNA.OKI2018_I69.chr2.g5643.t1.cds [Oikopleura dioica]